MPNPSDTPPTPLPLTRCPECGYDLTGLPLPARCPECGAFCDSATLILFGWPKNRFRTPGATAVFVLAICFGILFCADGAIGLVAMVVSLAMGRWNDLSLVWLSALITFGYLAAGAGLLALAFWFRRRRQRHTTNPESLGAPTIQLRISPAGYASRSGYGPVQYLHWIPDLEIDLSREGPVMFLRLARLTPAGVIDWSTLVDLAFQATPAQVAWLRTHLDLLRHAIQPHLPSHE